MKIDLCIGTEVHATEIGAAPRVGETIVFQGQSHTIDEIVHDADKRKLRVVCAAPVEPVVEEEFVELTESDD